MRHHGVLALRGFTLPPAAPPLAAAAFAFIGWPGPPGWPASGSGCTCACEAWAAAPDRRGDAAAGTAFEQVHALAAAGGAAASLLASAGFTADRNTDRADGRSRLVLLPLAAGVSDWDGVPTGAGDDW